VDHAVAEIVQVDPFRRDVGGQQQASRSLVLAKIFHDALLFDVRHGAAEDVDLSGFEAKVAWQVLVEKAERFNALGKDDQAIRVWCQQG
jgi:hypothetical protein